MGMPGQPFGQECSKFTRVHWSFHSPCIGFMLAIMHGYRPSFGVQKTALIAATAGCFALTFASPSQAATEEAPTDTGQCIAPGAESTVTTAQAGEVQTAKSANDETAPVLEESDDDSLRVATFDANLSRSAPGDLLEDLSAPGAEDATEVAKVIQQVRPDVLVLTGIDVDAGDDLVDAFNTNYLAVGSDQNSGMTYPYSYTAPSNAGVESGADLDRNGTIGGPGDALGYGDFPGQSSMIVYSKYPIDTDQIRDFTSLSWSKMPDNQIPDEVTDLERNILPMSSVSHWDIPVDVDGQTVHLLASSAADASEGTHDDARNHDQIRFWQDYLDQDSEYIIDHRGNRGPLDEDAQFIIAGSLKADPDGNGPADPTAITSLLESDAIVDPEPAHTLVSDSVSSASLPSDSSSPLHTAPDPSSNSENYRADYVLPSSDMTVTGAGTLETEAENRDNYRGFFGMRPNDSANHIVWADTAIDD